MVKEYYCTRPRTIDIYGVEVVVNFNGETFDDLLRRIARADGPNSVITSNIATAWIYKNLMGNVSKYDLDSQRNKELNNYDMLQNNGIMYHIESIVEMQLMAIITSMFMGYTVD